MRQPGMDGRLMPEISREMYGANFLELARQTIEQFTGVVARAVVDEDDFERRAAGREGSPQSLAQFHEHVGLIKQRHDDADQRIGNRRPSCRSKRIVHSICVRQPRIGARSSFRREPNGKTFR